jgi:CheY-like chemotaxis protein
VTPTDEQPSAPDIPPRDQPAASARVLVVDDHSGVRKGVIGLINTRKNFVVVGEAADGQEALDLVPHLAPDVILMDVAMPVMDGVDATRKIAALTDPPAVLLFTAWADRGRIAEAIAAGAAGHVLKDAPPAELLGALEAALAAPRPRLAELPVHSTTDSGVGRLGSAVTSRGRVRARGWPIRAAVGAAAVVILGTTGAAAASEGKLPPPIQAAARFVGLPTPTSHLDDARRDLARLDGAMRGGDPKEIAAAADQLQQRLGSLSASDQTRLGAAAALSSAQQRLAPGGSTGAGAVAPAAPAPAPPAATAITTTTTDDHRGSGSGTGTGTGTGGGGETGGGGGGTNSGGPGPGPATTTTIAAGASPATTAPDTSGKGGGSGGGDGGSHSGSSTTSPSGGGGHS